MRMDQEGLVLARLHDQARLPWPEILGWKRWRHGLVPSMPPGPVVLARDSTGVKVCLRDGRALRVSVDELEQGAAQLLRAFSEHDVPRMSRRSSA